MLYHFQSEWVFLEYHKYSKKNQKTNIILIIILPHSSPLRQPEEKEKLETSD